MSTATLEIAPRVERPTAPGTRVTKRYLFQTPQGPQTLADLFNGRAYLVVHHFSLAVCKDPPAGDSFAPDAVEQDLWQVEDREVEWVAVSRAPLEEIEAFRRGKRWDFRWVSSNGSDFNYDYHVTFHSDETASEKERSNGSGRTLSDCGEVPGTSMFWKDAAGEIFHIDSQRLVRRRGLVR